jgi:hypothetical protein
MGKMLIVCHLNATSKDSYPSSKTQRGSTQYLFSPKEHVCLKIGFLFLANWIILALKISFLVDASVN